MITTHAYDGLNRRVQTTDPLGHTTSLAYDARGQVESLSDPLGRTWHMGYDAAGNLSEPVSFEVTVVSGSTTPDIGDTIPKPAKTVADATRKDDSDDDDDDRDGRHQERFRRPAISRAAEFRRGGALDFHQRAAGQPDRSISDTRCIDPVKMGEGLHDQYSLGELAGPVRFLPHSRQPRQTGP